MINTCTQTDHCRLITEYIPTAHTAAIGIWLQNGARYESAEQTGYAHFLEHLVFKGTSDLNAHQLSTRFEVMGGQINAETGRELTSFYGTVPSSFAPELLQLLINMLTDTQLTATDFSLEREVVLQELAMLRDDPEEVLHDFCTEQVWPNHGMGRQILGTHETLKAATLEGFKHYLHDTVSANRVCIVAVGNFDQEAIKALHQGLKLPLLADINLSTPVYTSSRKQFDIDAEQQHLAWVMPTVSCRDHTQAACEIANHILGEGYDSRLYQVLREQMGLVYSIDSRNDHYADTGLWFIQTNTEHRNCTKTIKAVEQTLAQLIKEGPTDQELENARQHLQSALVIEADDLEARLDRLAEDTLYHGRIISLDEQLQQYKQVSIGDIQRVLNNAWQQASFFSTP